jgi:hypothetical protein
LLDGDWCIHGRDMGSNVGVKPVDVNIRPDVAILSSNFLRCSVRHFAQLYQSKEYDVDALMQVVV